ncbi:MAG: hypothetical protein ACFBSC_14375 [Microcoleaceae cyanobacterium]
MTHMNSESVVTAPLLVSLKTALLNATTLHQLSRLIEDYTHEEIMSIYAQLSSEEQYRIYQLWQVKSNPNERVSNTNVNDSH